MSELGGVAGQGSAGASPHPSRVPANARSQLGRAPRLMRVLDERPEPIAWTIGRANRPARMTIGCIRLLLSGETTRMTTADLIKAVRKSGVDWLTGMSGTEIWIALAPTRSYRRTTPTHTNTRWAACQRP